MILSDDDLVTAVRAGNQVAFESVFLTYYAGLCAFAFSYVHSHDTAEDVVSEVLTWVWEHHATWIPTVSIKTFLYGAVRNRCLNAARNEATVTRILTSTDAAFALHATHFARPDQSLDIQESLATLQTALATLRERTRAIMTLRWNQEMSWKEIAAMLGMSANAVEIEHRRALASLRQTLPQWFR